MKKIALILALFSFQAFAEVPEVVAKDMTCVELKETLQNYGRLIVVNKVLLFKKRLFVYQEANCSSDETKQFATFKTSNARYCNVGEYCKADPVYSDYTDYSGSGSGSSSSDSDSWSGGSSYGGGMSSSGSSSSSSSPRGPSYNPPSSGTRGTRYCPGC